MTIPDAALEQQPMPAPVFPKATEIMRDPMRAAAQTETRSSRSPTPPSQVKLIASFGNGAGRPSVRERILGALADLAQIGIDPAPRVHVAFLARYTNATSPAFRNPLGRLRTLGFATYPGPGKVAASGLLFLE